MWARGSCRVSLAAVSGGLLALAFPGSGGQGWLAFGALVCLLLAIENRTYLVRAANTGISGIVAPDGRIVRATGLSTPAVLSGFVRARAATSIYTQYGDVFAMGTVASVLCALLAGPSARVLQWLAARRVPALGGARRSLSVPRTGETNHE